jgi:hypothetical protein
LLNSFGGSCVVGLALIHTPSLCYSHYRIHVPCTPRTWRVFGLPLQALIYGCVYDDDAQGIVKQAAKTMLRGMELTDLDRLRANLKVNAGRVLKSSTMFSGSDLITFVMQDSHCLPAIAHHGGSHTTCMSHRFVCVWLHVALPIHSLSIVASWLLPLNFFRVC